MSRIYWDTMLFVYWLEQHEQYYPLVQHIVERMDQRQDRLLTSAFTVGEVLTGPKKSGHESATQRFREFFQESSMELVPFTAAAAEHYAEVRARNRISPSDALHLACAAEAGIDLFLTNDRRLHGITVPGIQFIADLHAGLL
jgi:predicted nucleic acid-binding protein